MRSRTASGSPPAAGCSRPGRFPGCRRSRSGPSAPCAARPGPLAEQAALHLGYGRDDGHVGLARRRAGIEPSVRERSSTPRFRNSSASRSRCATDRPRRSRRQQTSVSPWRSVPLAYPNMRHCLRRGIRRPRGRSRRPPCAAAGTLVLAPPRLANFARNGGFGADRGRTFGFRNEPRNAHARPSALLLDCGLWILLRSC